MNAHWRYASSPLYIFTRHIPLVGLIAVPLLIIPPLFYQSIAINVIILLTMVIVQACGWQPAMFWRRIRTWFAGRRRPRRWPED